MKCASRYVNEVSCFNFENIESGVHPRLLTDGFELAKEESLRFLDSFAVSYFSFYLLYRNLLMI